MKSSQSNFNLRSPSSYLARSYLIAAVKGAEIERGGNRYGLKLNLVEIQRAEIERT